MYRITFVLSLFKGEHDRELSHASLKTLLMALMHLDVLYLREHPETPKLYEANVKYAEEPPGQEDWQDVPTTLALGWGDCLPLDTLVLREDYTTVPIGQVRVGDRLVGDGRTTTVLEACVTKVKPILALDLDNGCTLRCSADHKSFLADDTMLRASEMRVGMRLKTPTSPFPTTEDSPWCDPQLSPTDLAWLTGVFVADGYSYFPRSPYFMVSGMDGNPGTHKRSKSGQKDRVIEIADRAGFKHLRRRKVVEVYSERLAEFMTSCGHTAINKHMPTLVMSEEQAKAAIEGLYADAYTTATGSVIHGTISPVLALQLRILYRMLGRSVHVRRWDAHGGLGQNPIYRVGLRRNTPKKGCKTVDRRATSAGIITIREEAPELVCDIRTDTGRFYLPESDVITSNCEDLACWRAAELRERYKVDAEPTFIWKLRPNGGYLYHILVRYPDGRIEDPSRTLGMR